LSLGFITIFVSCCDKNGEPEERPKEVEMADSLVLLPDAAEKYHVVINPEIKFQTVDNFGASDCWGVQYVGKWPSSKTNVMADWLFSLDTSQNGQPLGIGLSAWRFNIGAGSAGQGNESGINDPWRRSDCFRLSNGTYNFNRQAGQQWFLNAAHERGVNTFIGFSNSPPIYFTKNGKAYGDEGNKENIAIENLPDFSEFLVDVVQGIKDNTGIELSYISPVNEQQWDWTHGGQEGCYMNNSTLQQLIEILDQDLSQSSINTKIQITDAGKWNYLYGEGNNVGNQIEYFFGNNSSVNNTPNLARIITGHSYYSTTPETELINSREQVWSKASTIDDLKVWSTEYCPLGNGDLQELGWSSWQKDLGMDVALYVSKIIHHDLVYANVSAWQWWLSISPYNYPDGLIYVSKDNTSGTYQDSKLMWSLGNFSRFIRPGAKRIQSEYSKEDLFITSYIHEEDQTISIVVVNYSENTIPVKLDLEGSESKNFQPYITSAKDTHKLYPMNKINISNGFEMPPRCIITFTSNL